MNVWVKHGQVKVFNQKSQNIKHGRLIKVHYHFNLNVAVHLILHFDQAAVSQNYVSVITSSTFSNDHFLFYSLSKSNQGQAFVV
jgi:hypothetical protein